MAGGNSLLQGPDLAALFQQFLTQMVITGTTGAKPRSIPLVEKLVRQEDYLAWRTKTIRALARFDLDKYVLEDVPKLTTTEEAVRQWKVDRANVNDYLQALIPDYIV